MASLPATLLRLSDPDPADSAPDAVLLARFVSNRDRDAFAALVYRHGPVVYRVCRHLLGPAAAEDAFQPTFLVLATRATAVRKAGSVGSWLVGVAGRVARQMRNAQRRKAAREVPATDDIAAESQTEPSRLEGTEHLRILDEELARLPDRLRDPVVACLLQGRTYEQAAAELGGSPRTVRRRVERAKVVLRVRLERRGVIPAVAAGLAVGVGAVAAAVPAGLVARTMTTATDFMAGGTSPPAVIAKGVARTMSARRVTLPVAAAAVCLAALGVGLAGDEKPPVGPPAAVSGPAPVPPAGASGTPPPSGVVDRNFISDGPSPGSVRAVGGEAEFLRTHITRLWFGGEKKPDPRWKLAASGAVVGEPVQPPFADEIRVLYWRGGPAGSSTELTFKDGRLVRAWVNLSGPLEVVLDDQLPREMTFVVTAEQLGRPVPWWAGEGMATVAESRARKLEADARCRAGLTQGRCIRLGALFVLTDAPRDAEVASAQSFSVLRFLFSPKVKRSPRATLGSPEREAFFDFLVLGEKDGWDKAAKEIYQLDDVDALEKAWLDWMQTPGSKLPLPAAAQPPRRATPSGVPPTIPPVKLGDGK